MILKPLFLNRFRSAWWGLLSGLLLFLWGTPLIPAAHAAEGPYYSRVLDSIENWVQESPLPRLQTQALENYGLKINPYFRSKFELTNNVFQSPNSREDGTIWTFTPGVNMTHTGHYGQIGLSYEADFVYYTKYGSQNEQDQSFAAYGNFFPTENLEIQVNESLIQYGARAGEPAVEPVNFLDNTVDVALIRTWEEWVGSVTYQNFSREFAGDVYENFSYLENQFIFGASYQVNSWATAHAGYTIGWMDYDEDTSKNATYHELPFGLSGILPWQGIEYDATLAVHIRNHELVDRNDFWAFIGSVALSKQLTEKTGVTVGFLRRPAVSTFANVPFYDEKKFYAELTTVLSPRLRAQTELFHINRDWEESIAVGGVTNQRDDDVFGLGLDFDYAVRKWLVLSLGYLFERRDSNISDFDSTENRMTLEMTVPL